MRLLQGPYELRPRFKPANRELRISLGGNKPDSEKSSTIVGAMIFKEQIENSSQKS
jgi:hypothetical protein